MTRSLVLIVFSCTAVATGARAAERLPTIAPENYSAEQKQAAAEFLAARHTAVFGPFELLMYSPQLMSAARAMGDYLRSQHVSDRSFERAKARFGPRGVVDIAGIVGYYTLLAVQLNAAQYPAAKITAASPAVGR